MIIHTKDIIDRGELKVINKKQNLNGILKVKDRIVLYLEKGIKNTKEIENELKLKGRTTRKALFDLENEKIVKRFRKEKMKRKLGESDSWKLIKKKNILKTVPKGKICIFYNTYHGNKTYKNHFIIIPKILLLNENHLSALGFFQAEGSKKRKSVEIVNSELQLINLFLNFLDHFGIKKENLRFRITLNKKILTKLKMKRKNLEEKSMIFWNNLVDNSKYKYKKINYAGSSIGNLRKETPKHGSLSIEYCNTKFRLFLKKLLEYTKKNLVNKEDIVAYLRGFFAGEAYVGKKDREIQIASIDLEELNFVKKLLEKLDLPCSISKETSTSPPRIIITKLKSFLILEELDIFKFHHIKKRNLLIKMMNYKTLDENLRRKYNKKLNFLIQKRIST